MDAASESITSLLVITEWEKPEEAQESQQLFCHLECFKRTLDDEGNLYIGK